MHPHSTPLPSRREDAPLILVVSGLPASGKTNLSPRLAQAHPLPLITKGDDKQALHDPLPDLTRTL